MMICIFDCETIPDIDLILQIFKSDKDSELDIIKDAQEQHASRYNTTFLPLPYHKTVALSAVVADEFGRFIKVGDFGEDKDDEESIISHFFSFIEEKNPKLVSFNGRGFDMPMLLIRAMKYNISFPAWFDQSNPMLNKTKWENYRQRFAEGFHLDLLDSMGSFGAVRNLKLDTLCTMAGIPGKYDVSGDQVLDLYYDDKLELIKEYCQSDVLNTYWLYLKYELLRGDLNIDDYYSFIQTMRDNLPNLGYHKAFTEAIEQELGRYEDLQ